MSSSAIRTIEHRVRQGETLSSIARLHSITLAALRSANPTILDPSRISVGQVILIPKPSDSAGQPSVPSSGPVTPSAEDDTEATGDGADPNAILFEAESTGASNKTARQDGLPGRGI